jgi:TIR domain
MGLKIFISYSSRDRPDALRLKEIAEADGHDAWMDMFDIHPSARLAGELEQGVSSADVLCLLLSPSAVASPWVREELQYALAAEEKGLRVMPVILRAAPIPDELADHVALDATRGLADDATVMRIRRALGGNVEEAILLDALRRDELADRAAIEEAEEAVPGRREALERVIDEPIRELSVSIDQDTWPGDSAGVIEIALSIDIFVGSMSILLAPYVEGHTWRPDAGIDERPPDEFFASRKPRVDARLVWAGRSLTTVGSRDGTDLGELPLEFGFRFPGDEYTGSERARTMALLERFELPSLRQLIDKGASVNVWMHPPGGGDPEGVDPHSTDLRLRLWAPLRHDEAGIDGFELWRDLDWLDRVLWRAPTLQECAGDLERMALLSLYRGRELRADLNSAERRERIAAAVAKDGPVAEEDRWAAFNLSAGRANVPRLRGQLREAAQYGHEAVGLVIDAAPEMLDYAKAFGLLGTLTALVDDLARGGGTQEAIDHYSDTVVGLARRLSELHPDEADYQRALARNLMQRARLHAGTPRAVEDVKAAVSSVERLAQEEALPWRIDEARSLRRDAEALLEDSGAESIKPAPAGEPASWLDPKSIADAVPTLVFNRLLRFNTRLPPGIDAPGPRLTVRADELLGIWEREGSGAGFVIGLSDAFSEAGDFAADLAVGRAPSPLPGSGAWELEEWREDPPPEEFMERLSARSVRAFRAAMRASGGDARLRGYLLAVEKDGVRRRICVTLEPSGDDWRARAADDGLAAVVFRWLELS